MEVIVGSYNQVVFGFNFVKKSADEKEIWLFEPRFTDQGHAGSVKTVAVGARYLASGSTDETIRLFDLKKHIELGVLVQQNGSITKLEFAGTSHLLSASEDGTICVWKSKSWECEKVLKGHKGAVSCISIHPTGRLALSVSKDKTIKTWNLLTGRAVYTTSIKEVGEIVKWSPSGKSYIIVSGMKAKHFTITSIDDVTEYSTLKYILAVEFLTDNIAVIAGEDSEIVIYDFNKKVVLQRFEAHKVRTKAISVIHHPDEINEHMLFTVASDGTLKAWTINKDDLEEAPTLIASIDIPGRPTCMTVKAPIVKPAVKTTEATEATIADDETPVDEEEDSEEIITEVKMKEKPKKKKKNVKQTTPSPSSQKVKKKKKNNEAEDG